MIAIVSLLITLSVSLLVTRAASVALTLTGLSEESAKFQARSAFTGVGFTTVEAETIVNHPVRRRIVSFLMLTGNLGVAAVIASTIATFVGQGDNSGNSGMVWRMGILGLGLLMLWFVSTRKWVDRFIARWIEQALIKWTRLDVRDYVSLLHLKDGYVVLELLVNEGDWIAGKSLTESKLASEGILVLGIRHKNGQYLGSPNGKSMTLAGDTLSLYGPIERLQELDIRKKGYAGDKAHRVAIDEQQQRKAEDEVVQSETETSESQKQSG